MHVLNAVIFLTVASLSYASNCGDIAGLWRNQLGSNMTIIHRTANRITGQYSTAVETKKRAAVVSSNITGTFTPVKGGALLSFSVLFNNGKSLATWVGQCSVCGGREVLQTSWVLRTYVSKRMDRWMSARINHDTFERVVARDQIPPHLRMLGPDTEDVRATECEAQIKVGKKGYWVSEAGEKLKFSECGRSGVFQGSSSDIRLVGRKDAEGPFTSFGLSSMHRDIIKGWAGHMYGDVLETSTIEHHFSKDCKHPHSHVKYSSHNYVFDEDTEDAVTESPSLVTRFWRWIS